MSMSVEVSIGSDKDMDITCLQDHCSGNAMRQQIVQLCSNLEYLLWGMFVDHVLRNLRDQCLPIRWVNASSLINGLAGR
jgi:hypothetical protein